MEALHTSEMFQRYAPRLVIEHCLKHPAQITAPHSEIFPAAILFIDIAGFTPLTEKFAQRGAAGAEEFTHLLNDYFGKMIVQILSQGGDIVRFAGDALIAVWPAAEDDLGLMTLRATQCGRDIITSLNNYNALDDVSLKLKIAVASGDVKTTHVGGVQNQWEFLVGGFPFSQIGRAEKQADPGDLVLTPEAFALIQENGTARPLEEGCVLLESLSRELEPMAPDAVAVGAHVKSLKSYLMGPVRTRIEAGQVGWLAEFRKVTTLFVQVKGLDYSAPDAIEQLQTVVQVLQNAIYQYEGSVVSLGVDDKGTILLAGFGLPSLAHEDDAIRGMKSALLIQKEFHKIGFQSAVGITTGQVFCGPVGNEDRCSYTVMGDLINLSARLMQAAGDGVLCDEVTAKAVGAKIRMESLDPLTVKGKANPVPVARPAESGQDANPTQEEQDMARGHQEKAASTRLVGRKEERDLLVGKLNALKGEKSKSILIIEGEPGIGKSRLTQCLYEESEQLGIPYIIGEGDSVESSVPYYVWRPVFRKVLNLEDVHEDDHETQRNRILGQLKFAPQLLEMVPLLNAVFPLDFPDNDTTIEFQGVGRAEKTRDFLMTLLEGHLASTPTVLILEDGHWLDTLSWTLIGDVCQRINTVIVAITTRPLSDPVPPEYSQLLEAEATEHLVLDSLSPEEALDLVCLRLGVETLPDPVAKLIRDKAHGHPFFSEELAYALRDAGAIVIADGECQVASESGGLENLNLPDTVEGVITSRIDRLSAQQQLTMKVASVIGRTFLSRLARDVYPIEADKGELPAYLEDLRQMDLTQLEAPEPDLAYLFKHATIQEVSYNLMLYAQRTPLHQAIAEWYEQKHADDLAGFYSLLAYHWTRAVAMRDAAPEVVAKAVDYQHKAAERMMSIPAMVEAVSHLNQELELIQKLPESPQKVQQEMEAQTLLGYSLMNMRGYGDKDVETAYVRADELAQSIEETPKMGNLLYGLFSFYASRAEIKQATAIADRLMGLGERFDDPVVRLIAHNSIGIHSIIQGNLTKGREHTRQCYEIADAHEAAHQLIQYGGDFRGYPRSWYTIAQCLLGYPDTAQRVLEEALELTQKHPYTQAFVLNFGAVSQLRRDIEGTKQRADELAALAGQLGFMLLGVIANIYKGWALAQEQKTAESLGMIEQSLPVARFVHLASFMPWYLAMYAESQHVVGQTDKALESLSEALTYVENAGGNFYEAELHRLKGEFLLAQNAESAEVQGHFQKAVDVARRQEAKWWELRATVSLCRLMKTPDTRQRLAAIHGEITEGAESADMQDAAALLAELA